MPSLDAHRKVAALVAPKPYQLQPPFSFFNFVEDEFDGLPSLRRIFSLARSSNTKTLIYEKIPPTGIIADENEEIKSLFPTHTNSALFRLSFWGKSLPTEGVSGFDSSDLVGYAILKKDSINGEIGKWHVFEAVINQTPHPYNCIPRPQTYCLRVDDKPFEIIGILYCQQNALNKACAQVALRSLLSRILPEGDISYRRINEIADSVLPGFIRNKGLSAPQIRQILIELNLRFNDVDYDEGEPEIQRKELPYQKYAYAGLESGGGSLVGFKLPNKVAGDEAWHIIPIFGHTFNKDTWVPDADFIYFSIEEGVGYIPSESWTSDFLGHDDNCGPNFCIPRLYIDHQHVDYVIEIFRPGILYSGMNAEALSINLLDSALENHSDTDTRWIQRIRKWTFEQQVVFRAQAMTKTEYCNHLRSIRDWEGNREKPDLIGYLEKEIPEFIWAVEISTPQLFPANERKLGEIVLDATRELNTENETSCNEVFIFVRLPGVYLFGGDLVGGHPQFTPIQSELKSHTGLIKF